MKRELLKELGLTDEQIDKIMTENGKDIEKYKGVSETKENELKTLKDQLEIANNQIEEFKEMDIGEIKKTADKYREKYKTAKSEAEKELETIKFNHAIEKTLAGAKAKNVKAVKALLDMKGLKRNNDEIVGLNEQLEKIKKENDYLFEGEGNKVPSDRKSVV